MLMSSQYENFQGDEPVWMPQYSKAPSGKYVEAKKASKMKYKSVKKM